ncbi:MAG: TspO/MBR family protein [Paracoccaceae bacterium]|nr:TspO/MBR family protein [Paracoccaceae bacterium]
MDIVLFAIFLAACFGAGATGAMFPPGEWYERLAKPSWNPPNWVFPVAWTLLYLCIAAAAARAATVPGSAYGMAFLAVQFSLNALWTPVFFGLRRMKAALVVVLCLWVAVAATMLAFFQLDTLAGALFIPYLLWVTVASALNYTVWRMNPDVEPLTP